MIPIGGVLLDACVLAILTKEDAYGYQLTQILQRVLDISESTLYPVLRRLQKEGFLSTYDVPHDGRNRRYYKLTDTGEERLTNILQHWQLHKEKIDHILLDKGEKKHDH